MTKRIASECDPVPPAILQAHSDLRRRAIPAEFVIEAGGRLCRDFLKRARHLTGPLDIVLQASRFASAEGTAVRSLPLWRNIPRLKALALAHIIAELLFLGGHNEVAVALVDSAGLGLVFQFTSFDGDFVCREIIGQSPNGEVAA